ncbi:competence protein CoiA family protein [Caenispirillum bisanense]|uniref:competence protein CoiA family protein n=1 Tax=Caenispirillum bisanense TaxID=414052 RepID=UPI000BE40A83|nr:competence protein CoiA family protein [Caenispirillum bisanense]
MSDVHIAWAVRGEHLVSIEQVPSGLAADCTCPECGASLIARRGEERDHHFAHQPGARCVLAAGASAAGLSSTDAELRLAMRVLRAALSHRARIQLPNDALTQVIDRDPAVRMGNSLLVDQIVVMHNGEPRTVTIEVTATRRLSSERIELLRAAELDVCERRMNTPQMWRLKNLHAGATSA